MSLVEIVLDNRKPNPKPGKSWLKKRMTNLEEDGSDEIIWKKMTATKESGRRWRWWTNLEEEDESGRRRGEWTNLGEDGADYWIWVLLSVYKKGNFVILLLVRCVPPILVEQKISSFVPWNQDFVPCRSSHFCPMQYQTWDKKFLSRPVPSSLHTKRTLRKQ